MRSTAVGLAAMALLLLTEPARGLQIERDLPVKELVARATRYVGAYQREFSFLLADEVSEQVVDPPLADGTTRRTTRGELYLTYLAADRRWVAVHDVAEVDGAPVEDRLDLPALLRSSAAASIARQLFAHNARYNLGPIVRNFNEPTLALSIFGPTRGSEFRFTSRRIEASTGGIALATLDFEERGQPTLIRSTRGDNVRLHGQVTIEAATGRVQRTRLAIADDGVAAELVTTYAADLRVGLWVPTIFSERYTARRSGRVETVSVESRYLNYRQFGAIVRVR